MGSRPSDRPRGPGAAPPPALRGGRARRRGSGRPGRALPEGAGPLLANPLPPPPVSGARAREPEARGGGRGGGRRGRAGGGGERKAKVSEKLTKGESNFFLLARSLPLSLGVALSPGQIIFRAFEIVGARAPPLASASWAQRRETPSRGGGGGGGAGRRPPRFAGAGAGVAAAGQLRPLGEQNGDVFLGLEVWSGSLFPTGAPRGGGRSSVTPAARSGSPCAGASSGRVPTRTPSDPPLPPPSAPLGPAWPLLPLVARTASRPGGDRAAPGEAARSPVLLSLSLRLGPSPKLRAPSPPPAGSSPPARCARRPPRHRPPRLGATRAPSALRPPAPSAERPAGPGPWPGKRAGGSGGAAGRRARLPEPGRGPAAAKRRAPSGKEPAPPVLAAPSSAGRPPTHGRGARPAPLGIPD